MKNCRFLLIALSFVISDCGGESGSAGLANPEWRESMPATVSFPLTEAITFRVGLPNSDADPGPGNASIEWLADRTNINLKFEVIPQSPGDVILGEIIRDGRLYDIIPGGRLDLSDGYFTGTLVNFREFPDLVPNARMLAAEDELYRAGLAAHMMPAGELYTLGTYDPTRIPFAGTLAYRKDLFDTHGLEFGTWEELKSSLKRLKEIYPDSSPLGCMPDDIYHVFPALFGSGYTKDHLLYFDPDNGEWRFGPYEESFERFVRFLSRLYADGILLADFFSLRPDDIPRLMSNDVVFVSTYAGLTGPYFRFYGEEYGELNDAGEWNKRGKWIESMRPPTDPDGSGGKLTSSLHSYVGGGWHVNNQSAHVAEAIALLDFLFEPETALSVQLGPSGLIWDSGDAGPYLKPDYAEAYAGGALTAVTNLADEKGVVIGSPLIGLARSTPFDLFGTPSFPEYRYYLNSVAATYRPGFQIPLDPGLSISQSEDFISDRVDIIVSLQTHIESQVARFIIGQRSLDEFEDFKEECRSRGADDLLKYYAENTKLIADPIF